VFQGDFFDHVRQADSQGENRIGIEVAIRGFIKKDQQIGVHTFLGSQ